MDKHTKLVAETRHLRLVERGGWSYVERPNANGVVCIVAVTDEKRILLVEQYRPPTACNVIELPAGLSGDLPGQSNEDLEQAAKRELLEETGYQAAQMVRKASLASSAGLTNEVITMFIAKGLKKIAPGGGDASEKITVHEISLDDVDHWLDQLQQAGRIIDSRVYAALYLLKAGQ